MNPNKPITISERELPAFRQEFLVPEKILDQIERTESLLLQLPLGGGKSFAADQLLASEETFNRYDSVIYVGPTHAIIRERVAARKNLHHAPKHVVLEPRPRKRCGERDEAWIHFEAKGCINYAKETLCTPCPERQGRRPCKWPQSLKKKIGDAPIVFCTEQFFVIDPAFLFRLKRATGAEKLLIIFDEAKLSHHPFEFRINADEIRIFLAALKQVENIEPKAGPYIERWICSLNLLLIAED